MTYFSTRVAALFIRCGWDGRLVNGRLVSEDWIPCHHSWSFCRVPSALKPSDRAQLRVAKEVKPIALEEILSLISAGVMTIFGGQTMRAVIC